MRLLDAGCGPGSITIGLAAAVAPAETVGIDTNAEAIDGARRRAHDLACPNVRFDVASVYALPFDDATFDAAFMHAVLQHLDRPLDALREVRRVLKPGAVIGLADADYDGSFIAPEDPLLARSFEVMARLRAANGGDVRVGKKLRQLLHDAGYHSAVAFVTGAAEASTDAVRYTGQWQARYFAAPAFVDRVVANGISTPREMAAISGAWQRWSEQPGAIWARFWCQAIAWA